MNEYREVLLIDEDYIKTNTNLNNNVSGDFILSAIYFAQHQKLEEILGTELVEKLQYLVGSNTLYNPQNYVYKNLLDNYVMDYLAFETISQIIPIVSFKIGNSGAIRNEEEKVFNLSFDEVFRLKDYYQNKADYLKYRLQRFLIANYVNYPELVTYKSIADLQTNLYSAASVPIWLGGSRCPKNYTKPSLKDIYNFPSSSDNNKKGGE